MMTNKQHSMAGKHCSLHTQVENPVNSSSLHPAPWKMTQKTTSSKEYDTEYQEQVREMPRPEGG